MVDLLTIKTCLRIFAIAVAVMLTSACDGKGPEKTAQVAMQGVLSGAFDANGRSVVIGSIHHGGSLWNLAKKERMYDWNHSAGEKSLIRAAGLSGDGKTAVTAVEDALAVWDTVTGASKGFWKAPARVLRIKVSDDGRKALLGLNNQQAIYFDLVSGSELYRFAHSLEVRAVDMDAAGKVAITGSDDGEAKIWSLQDGSLLHTVALKNQIKTVAISADGELAFATAQREDAVVVRVDTGKVKSRMPNRYTNFTVARFSKDARQLLLGTFQGQVQLVDAGAGKVLKKWQAKPRKAYGGASSKAIVDVVFGAKRGSALALASDGMVEWFQ